MNAQEYFLVSKMVEHINVVSQYARILYDETFDELFKNGQHNLEADLQDLRTNLVAALEKYESVENTRIITEIAMLPESNSR